jgi:hypothetical protein
LSLYRLDEQAFRVSRKELLGSLLADGCVAPVFHTDESTRSFQGQAFARPDARASYMGPVVAVEPEVGLRLLDSMLQRLAGAVFVDVCHCGKDVGGQLVRRGFARQRNLTRMSLRQQIDPTSDMVFAIAGPELG